MKKKIKFWTDVWLGGVILSSRFPNLYNCSVNKEGFVAEFYSTNGWQLNPRRGFND